MIKGAAWPITKVMTKLLIKQVSLETFDLQRMFIQTDRRNEDPGQFPCYAQCYRSHGYFGRNWRKFAKIS